MQFGSRLRFPSVSSFRTNIGGLAQHTTRLDRIVTWGEMLVVTAQKISKVQGLLRNVQQLQARKCAFAAILADGSVLAWGSQASGGDSSNVQTQLRSVQKIQATSSAFAAVVTDGSVVAWGNQRSGGNAWAVRHHLRNA